MNIQDKIEKILDSWDDFDRDKTINEILTLIQESNKEAVEGFVLGIMRKYVLNISLNDLEDDTVEYLSSIGKDKE